MMDLMPVTLKTMSISIKDDYFTILLSQYRQRKGPRTEDKSFIWMALNLAWGKFICVMRYPILICAIRTSWNHGFCPSPYLLYIEPILSYTRANILRSASNVFHHAPGLYLPLSEKCWMRQHW